ncbi:MAG: hypothetical protein AAFQ78_01890 [Bacteroidota bacterium]
MEHVLGDIKGFCTKAFDIAKNMLHQLHMGIDKVQQATGLSRIELERIAQKA